MHIAQELPEGDVVLQIKDVLKSVSLCWVVIEHQEHASERKHDEEIEGNATHTPGKWVTHRVAINFRRVKV